MFYVYVLYSESHQVYYKGFTENVTKRFNEHNNNLSRYTAGKKSNKSLQRKNLMKNRTKLNPKLFKDTNSIYPLNKQYKDNELKSPYKQRPLSGGPSPDKFKIEYEKGPKYKYGE